MVYKCAKGKLLSTKYVHSYSYTKFFIRFYAPPGTEHTPLAAMLLHYFWHRDVVHLATRGDIYKLRLIRHHFLTERVGKVVSRRRRIFISVTII